MNRSDLHIRDPFVLVHGGKYYLTGTTGGEIRMYESQDLENFVETCVLVQPQYLTGCTDVWAPEIHEYQGRFYLIFSVYKSETGRGSIIFVSNDLNGDFKPLTGEYITPAGWGCLDATLFVYRGAPYLCFSNEWTTPVSHDGDGSLFIARLSDDLTRLAEPPKKIVSGKHCGFSVQIDLYKKIFGYVAEGPYLYEENGEIALLWSTFTKTGYSVIKSVSRSGIYGGYTYEKTVFDKDGGHCMRFIDLSGKPKIVLHRPNVSPLERAVFLED